MGEQEMGRKWRNNDGNLVPIQLARVNDNAVPISFIVRTGQAPLSRTGENHSTIDFSAKDASGIRALENATARAFALMQADAPLQALLAQPTWDREQRVVYESHQADAVARSFRDDPLIAKYRSANSDKVRSEPQDLTHLKQGDEFDCDKIAIMKGVVISRIEASLLHGKLESFKSPREYYVVGGAMRLVGDGKPVDLHAALMSSATGNMIEPTMNRESYFAAKNFSFADYVAGKPFIAGKDVMVKGASTHFEYQMGSLASSRQQHDQRAAAIGRNDLQRLQEVVEPRRVTLGEFETTIAEAHRWSDTVKMLDLQSLTLDRPAPNSTTTSPVGRSSQQKQPELRSR